MKSFFVIALVLMFTSLYGQKDKKNAIKINSLSLLSGIYELQYERVLTNRSSVQLGFGLGKTNNNALDDFQKDYFDFFGKTLNNPQDPKHTTETFTFNLTYRLYTKEHTAFRGFYIGPSIQYIHYEERFSAFEQDEFNPLSYSPHLKQRTLNLVNIRALLGYQFLLGKHFAINPYAGPSLIFGNTDPSFQKEDENYKGFGLNFGLDLGIIF